MAEIIDGYKWANMAPFIYSPFTPLIVSSVVIDYGLSHEILKIISEDDFWSKEVVIPTFNIANIPIVSHIDIQITRYDIIHKDKPLSNDILLVILGGDEDAG